MLFTGNSGAQKRKLILDVSCSSVSGALVEYAGRGRFESKKSFHSPNVILAEVDLPALWRKVQALVQTAVQELKSSTGVDEALVVFSSPWYFSEVRRILEDSKEPVAVNPKFIENILEKDKEEFQKSILRRFNMGEKDSVVLPAQTMRVNLNGYPVNGAIDNLTGKKARTLEALLYSSVVFSPAAEYVRRVLEDKGIRRIQVATSPFALYKAALWANEPNLLIVKVVGEITEVVLLKNGVVGEVASFGKGFNHIVRRSAPIFNLGLEETSALIKASAEKVLEAARTERVKQVLKEGVQEWQNLFMEVLRQMSFKELLPEKAALLGCVSEFEEFRQAVVGQGLFKLTLIEQPSSVLNSYLIYGSE